MMRTFAGVCPFESCASRSKRGWSITQNIHAYETIDALEVTEWKSCFGFLPALWGE
jgi:hypothetical protein